MELVELYCTIPMSHVSYFLFVFYPPFNVILTYDTLNAITTMRSDPMILAFPKHNHYCCELISKLMPINFDVLNKGMWQSITKTVASDNYRSNNNVKENHIWIKKKKIKEYRRRGTTHNIDFGPILTYSRGEKLSTLLMKRVFASVSSFMCSPYVSTPWIIPKRNQPYPKSPQFWFHKIQIFPHSKSW